MIMIKCKNCHYMKPFQLGIGFAYSPNRLLDFDSKDSLLNYLIRSKKTLEHVKNLILEHDGDFIDYDLKLHHCPKCSGFYARFYYQIQFTDGLFEPDYKCTKCKHKLDVVPEQKDHEREEGVLDLSDYPCPECGEKSVSYYNSGNWD